EHLTVRPRTRIGERQRGDITAPDTRGTGMLTLSCESIRNGAMLLTVSPSTLATDCRREMWRSAAAPALAADRPIPATRVQAFETTLMQRWIQDRMLFASV